MRTVSGSGSILQWIFIGWIISLYFREILFCEYEIFENNLKSLFIMFRVHFKLMKMGIPAGNPVLDLCDRKLLFRIRSGYSRGSLVGYLEY